MMAVTALVLFGVIGVLGGGLRIWLQRRRTGDTGVRQFSIPVGSTQWWGHWTMNLGVLLTWVAAPIASLVGLAPLPGLEHPIVQILGVILAAIGIVATLTAQLQMGASWRIAVDETERTALVSGGAFRVIRNPIFTAVATALLGLTLMVPNTIAVAGLAAAIVGIEIQVRLVEEPYLHRFHGAAYDDYASRVGRFLPVIGRLRSAQPDRR
jgi:protein-S-isoprenylcysteine O-methyltransferase Ste14